MLPRRTRFYHAKIDAANLVAGEDYGCLRDVAVIFITTYDPFDRNRMVYTVKNRCLEVPDLPFEDGAVTLYLYTKGTEGDAPEELKNLLRYMEDSTEENAVTEGLKELHRMVTAVKRDGEVGVAYMKSFEREERIRREARSEGRSEGLELGRSLGMEQEKRNTVRRMLGMKLPPEQIAQIVGESVATVKEWSEEALPEGEEILRF